MIEDRTERGEEDIGSSSCGEVTRRLSRIEELLGNLIQSCTENSQRIDRVEANVNSRLQQVTSKNDDSITAIHSQTDNITTAEIHFSKHTSRDRGEATKVRKLNRKNYTKARIS